MMTDSVKRPAPHNSLSATQASLVCVVFLAKATLVAANESGVVEISRHKATKKLSFEGTEMVPLWLITKRRKIMKQWQPILIVLVLTLSGCATSSEEVADESLGAAEKVCVSVRSINSFDAIDDKHLYIEATGNKHYLFTLHAGCTGLRSAHRIAVKDTFSRVCSNSFGEIVYRDMGRSLESCSIRNVEAVASKDEAGGLVEDRKSEKREKQSESE